jgi:hypothetical protein
MPCRSNRIGTVITQAFVYVDREPGFPYEVQIPGETRSFVEPASSGVRILFFELVHS